VSGSKLAPSHFASPIGLDRLVRKEVSLGAVREIQPPQEHIGLTQIAPFLDVESDDVIFDYIKGGLQDGLAPARAEDAESELSQKDDLTYGQGRAAIVDWSLKDKYTASDVTRYREGLLIQQAVGGQTQNLPLNFTGRATEDFERRLARHDALRRRKLDNRLEWLIMQSIETGGITYNDGKIKFTVSYGRPAGQQNQAPASGLYNTTTFDPIGDINAMNDTMFATYGVRMTRAITSRKVLNTFWKSDKFVARTGLVVGGSPATAIDPNYLLDGWGPDAAQAVIERATGVRFIEYDSVYRSRNVGSTTWTNNRFLSENKIYFLPEESDLGEVDDTEIGFGKTLTSPHPEGDWQSGYYEWEDEKRDPWMHVRGTGVKAFPVFPYLEYSYTMTVLP
jgi:hypothetical protein